MKLYLVQHAQAKSKDEDPERGITEEGYIITRKIANFAKQIPIEVRKIYHSGKKRAKQTAEIFSEYLTPQEGLKSVEGLRPMDSHLIWADLLSNIDDNIMIVGHLPHLQKLSNFLVLKDASKEEIKFINSGIVCLERYSGKRWVVVLEINPENVD
ncbi:MAG: phosphohistidine phosphatase SixA [Promethearchaeota archaeon]